MESALHTENKDIEKATEKTLTNKKHIHILTTERDLHPLRSIPTGILEEST